MDDFSCPTSTTAAHAVVPCPRFVQRDEGRYAPSGVIRVEASADSTPIVSRLLAGLCQLKLSAELNPDSEAGPAAEIRLERDADLQSEAPESYRLIVSPRGVIIRATTVEGWGHGVQTFLDLWDEKRHGWPALQVQDAPVFGWRGLLLDCCRHYVSKAGIFRILDGMAAVKLNRFHWHLTDDQAWRIEIKHYPRLTEIGASRADEAGGRIQYYSHEDIRAVVAYAKNLGIEVMPEIEMPGHATAALAAYPELGCNREPLEVKAAWGLFPHNFNAGDDRVFDFLENVLREVMDLFPFPYIHLGADECDKTQWKACPDCQRRIQAEGLADENGLQSYFVNRIAAFLDQHGRTAMGWDEILEGEPRPGMLVQAWRDERIIKLAATRGFAVIASPRRYCYLDMAISQIDLRDVRGFDPTAGLDETTAKKVWGAEANMWTEYVHESELEQMIFPRLWGLSEALWCGTRQLGSFAEFKARVDTLTQRSRARGLQPGPALQGDITESEIKGRTDLDEPAPGIANLA